MTVHVRPATRDDIEAFSEAKGKPTVRAMVAEDEGKVIAMFGVAFAKGRWVAFYDIADDVARTYKMTTMRWALRFFAEQDRLGVNYIYAEASPNEPGSKKWLKRLGFEIDPRGRKLYRRKCGGK